MFNVKHTVLYNFSTEKNRVWFPMSKQEIGCVVNTRVPRKPLGQWKISQTREFPKRLVILLASSERDNNAGRYIYVR